MLSNINLLASTALLSLAGAATLRVDVGKNGLAFSPNSTVANVGDVVEFHYYPKNHSVVETSFAGPCEFDLHTPFFSGFMPTASGEGPQLFQVTVTSTSPIWFYCSQARHCQSGMVGVINEPKTNKTLAAFAAAAAKAGNSTSPSTVAGGVIVANTASSNSSISASSTASATNVSGSPSSTASSTSSSTSSSSSSSPTANTSGAVAMKALRWTEFLGMGVFIGAAALLMQ